MLLLNQKRILMLHATVVEGALTTRRAVLLGGIHSGFAGGLPIMADPSSQILSDLNCLNAVVRLKDGSVPLQQWLENAMSITAGRHEEDVFKDALSELLHEQAGTVVAGRPRLLVLAAGPVGRDQLALGREIREIERRLRDAGRRSQLDLVSELAVRRDDIGSCLVRHEPTVVHMSTHGSNGRALLETADGGPAEVELDALVQLFAPWRRRIRCAVLNWCSSAVQAKALAQEIEFVVGLSEKMNDASSAAFAGAFHQALAVGENVQRAFELGCAEISVRHLPGAEVPGLEWVMVDPSRVRPCAPAT